MSLPSARSIAFNRRLRFVWLEEALRLRAENVDPEQWLERVEDLVSKDIKGKDSIQKSMRYLRHVWSDAGGIDKLRSNAIEIYRLKPSVDSARILSWGMVIATYPFLNEVATVLGRMLKVQNEVKLEQILRKLSETHGEKETVRRSSRYALGLIHEMEFIRRTKSVGCYELTPPRRIDSPGTSAWFVKTWFRAIGKDSGIDRTTMMSTPSLAFFDVPSLIADALNEGALEVERLSFSQDSLRLKE